MSLTRSAALEGKPKGIRVNAVLPGAVDTPMLWQNPNIRSGVETIDADHVGQPDDVAATIAYLASDDAAFVQGAMVRVDGGRLDRLRYRDRPPGFYRNRKRTPTMTGNVRRALLSLMSSSPVPTN